MLKLVEVGGLGAETIIYSPWAPTMPSDHLARPNLGRPKCRNNLIFRNVRKNQIFSKIIKNKISRPLVFFCFIFKKSTFSLSRRRKNGPNYGRLPATHVAKLDIIAWRHVSPGNVRKSVRFIRRRDSENVDFLKMKKKNTGGREILFSRISKKSKFSKFRNFEICRHCVDMLQN